MTKHPPLSLATILAILVASAIVGGFAISSQSYWIDEATSVLMATAKSPTESWHYAKIISGSNIQMPLYQVYLYAWDKVFHGTEWTVRASNIPFLLLAQLAFLYFLRHRPRLAIAACILSAVSPTTWMYLDEARPYLMQFAAGSWLIAAIVRFSLPPDTTEDNKFSIPPCTALELCAIFAATLVLIGASFLGILWSAGALAALAWLYLSNPRRHSSDSTKALSFLWKNKIIVVVFFIILCGFFAYHAWVWPMARNGLFRGGLGFANLPYIAYEFLGFSGYGPSKLQLRSSIKNSLFHHLFTLLPLLVVFATLALYTLSKGLSRRPSRRIVITWTLAIIVPTAISFVGMYFGSFRALPRHFIPALPAVIIALAAIMTSALTQKRLLWRFAAILLPLLWLGSSLNLRWKPIHAKDDYRTAAAIAASALRNNKEVWWAADASAAYIYLTPVAFENIPGRAWAMQSPSWNDIRFKFPPRVIIVSKPDLYDSQGAVIRYAAENQFSPAIKLQAFTIFTRKGETLDDLNTLPTEHQ